jgi:hypothetical protein
LEEEEEEENFDDFQGFEFNDDGNVYKVFSSQKEAQDWVNHDPKNRIYRKFLRD